MNDRFNLSIFSVLQLNTPIHVTGFTMEHIPISLAPNGKIDSAPKLFSVWVCFASLLRQFLPIFFLEKLTTKIINFFKLGSSRGKRSRFFPFR